MTPHLVRILAATVSILLTVSSAVLGQDGQSGYDRVWGLAELYEGDSDDFFQSLDLSGRLQLDLAFVDSGDDDHGEFNVRRFRFGFKTVFLEDFTFHIEGEFNPQEADPVYTRLTDTYLAWSHTDALTVTAGKHSAGFTLDGMTSSKKLLTIDRNNLTNNIWFTEEYIPGVSFKGETKNLLYHAGVFSSGDKDPEFGDFSGGQFVLLTLGHDFADRLGAEEALLRLNLVDNEPDPDNGFTRDLKHIVSLNFSYETDRWGARADVSAADGYFEQSDLWGIAVMPFYNLSEKLQLVARYTFVESDDVNGVRLARYETTLEHGRGDRYNEIHFGVNYYFYGHELKIQNGVQYIDMDDRAGDSGEYRGWSATSGFRVSW